VHAPRPFEQNPHASDRRMRDLTPGIELHATRIVDHGSWVPRDLPGEPVGISEVGTDTTPWWRGRFPKNVTACLSRTLEQLVDLRSRPHVLGKGEEHATLFGVRTSARTRVLRKRITREESEELPPHLEERDVLVAALVFRKPHVGVEAATPRKVADTKGHEGDVVTKPGAVSTAHGSIIKPTLEKGNAAGSRWTAHTPRPVWNHPERRGSRAAGRLLLRLGGQADDQEDHAGDDDDESGVHASRVPSGSPRATTIRKKTRFPIRRMVLEDL